MGSLLCDRALKEWAVVVDALAAGDQTVLLRKGGIEDVGGEFRLETDSFVLWPTYLHQDTDWLAPSEAGRLANTLARRPDGDEVLLACYAVVERVDLVPDRAALDRLHGQHIWSSAYLDLRWNYRPELPLYQLTLQVYRLPEPVRRAELPAHRGCRSWVTLEPPISLAGAIPVPARVAATPTR